MISKNSKKTQSINCVFFFLNIINNNKKFDLDFCFQKIVVWGNDQKAININYSYNINLLIFLIIFYITTFRSYNLFTGYQSCEFNACKIYFTIWTEKKQHMIKKNVEINN